MTVHGIRMMLGVEEMPTLADLVLGERDVVPRPTTPKKQPVKKATTLPSELVVRILEFRGISWWRRGEDGRWTDETPTSWATISKAIDWYDRSNPELEVKDKYVSAVFAAADMSRPTGYTSFRRHVSAFRDATIEEKFAVAAYEELMTFYLAHQAMQPMLVERGWLEAFNPVEVQRRIEEGTWNEEDPVVLYDAPFDDVGLVHNGMDLFTPDNRDWWFVRDIPQPQGETKSDRAGRAKNALILSLKSYFWFRILDGIPTVAAYGDHWRELGSVISEAIIMVIDVILSLVVALYEACSLNWYYEQPPWFKICVESALITFVIWKVLSDRPRFVITEAPLKKPDQFLGQIMTTEGVVYRVRVDGKVHELSADVKKFSKEQDEMAMPGSEYYPCRSQPVGAILVATSESELRMFATFWRMDGYLVTARHVSNTLYQATATVYFATVVQTAKGNWEVNRKRVKEVPNDFFDPENNLVASYDVDVFVREVDDKFWSTVSVTKASTKIRSAYDQQIQAVGFTPAGLLVSSSGKTLPESTFDSLAHTASTQKGFSGSIILCGNSVVGMHVRAASENNVAIRVEFIKYLIDECACEESRTRHRGRVYTYADASIKEEYRANKMGGRLVDVNHMRNGKYAVLDEDGRATYGWEMHELVEIFGRNASPEKNYDQIEDLMWKNRSRGNYVTFDDERRGAAYENADLPLKSRRKSSKLSKRLAAERVDHADIEIRTGLKPVTSPSAPTPQPEISTLIEEHMPMIEELGYEKGQYEYPDLNPAVETSSLIKHCELFARRQRAKVRVVNSKTRKRCAAVVAQMLQSNTFTPRENYKTLEGVLDVINSSVVGGEKSSGFDYCANGMPTNKLVLEKYGEKAFAQEVLNKWNEKLTLKWFGKPEPNKRKKIASGMPRGVAGFPLHAMVKHASIFLPLAKSMTGNWMSSPVKYAFSPALPGHMEHLKSWLSGKIWESDKPVFDYMFDEVLSDICCQVVKLLAVKPASWSDEQFAQYKTDVEESFKQVFENYEYRTSDGTAVRAKLPGIMKSGWFMTIVINSMSQLVIHALTMIELEYSNEQILAAGIFVGGDDVNQEPLDCGKEAYEKVSRELGYEIEILERESLEQSEYFSCDLRLGKEGWEFYPKRFTKHIEHLRTIKIEYVADALCSHMENYRHDPKKFSLFEMMYHSLRKTHPGLFPLNRLRSREFLLAKQYGYEMME